MKSFLMSLPIYKILVITDTGEELPFSPSIIAERSCFIDMLHNKIYLNGERLTSKDIYTQQYTCDFLFALMTSPHKEFDVQLMKKASYVHNRYEFFHKVVNPFLKSVKKYLGKDISITCIGTINDFIVKLLYSDVEIAFLCTKQQLDDVRKRLGLSL